MAWLCVAPAIAAPKKSPPRPVVEAPLPDLVRVVLTTEAGPITVELDAKRAPVTVRNFVRYVDQKRFDGIVFYRVMRLGWGEQPNGLIQAGTRGGAKRVLPSIAHETTAQTGITHKAGTFGRVVEGMETVRRIYDAPLSPMLGEGMLKGQMLDPGIRIVTARRVP